MTNITKKLGTLALVSLLVLSSISTPVMAVNNDGAGETLGEAACAVAPALTQLLSPQCTVEYGDVDGATATQVHYDIKGDAVFLQDKRNQVIEQQTSQMEQAQAVALAEAKETLIRALNNGTAKSVAIDKARKRVDEVLAEYQKSLAISQNRQVQHFRVMDQQMEQVDNLSPTNIIPKARTSNGYTANQTVVFSNATLTLFDGETLNVTRAQVVNFVENDGYDGLDKIVVYVVSDYGQGLTGQQAAKTDYTVSPTLKKGNANIVGPNGETSIALDASDYSRAFEKLRKSRQDAQKAVKNMADSIYQNYQPGEVSVSTLQGPIETIVTSSTNDNALIFRLKSAAVAGYAVADDGSTVTVTSDFDDDGQNETKSGVIFAQPGVFANNTVTTGTYDGTQLNGTVRFISNPNSSVPEDYTLNQTFTVESITGPSGNETSTLTLTSNKFSTTGTQQLNQQIKELKKKLENLEDRYDQKYVVINNGGNGGGGTGFGGLFGSIPGPALVVAGLVIVLLLMLGFAT